MGGGASETAHGEQDGRRQRLAVALLTDAQRHAEHHTIAVVGRLAALHQTRYQPSTHRRPTNNEHFCWLLLSNSSLESWPVVPVVFYQPTKPAFHDADTGDPREEIARVARKNVYRRVGRVGVGVGVVECELKRSSHTCNFCHLVQVLTSSGGAQWDFGDFPIFKCVVFVQHCRPYDQPKANSVNQARQNGYRVQNY